MIGALTAGGGASLTGSPGGLEVRLTSPANGQDAIPVRVPYDLELTGWELVADAAGSITLDVWADTFAHYPPVLGDSIAGTGKPALSGASSGSGGVGSWGRTSLLEGERVWVHVDATAGLAWAVLSLVGDRA